MRWWASCWSGKCGQRSTRSSTRIRPSPSKLTRVGQNRKHRTIYVQGHFFTICQTHRSFWHLSGPSPTSEQQESDWTDATCFSIPILRCKHFFEQCRIDGVKVPCVKVPFFIRWQCPWFFGIRPCPLSVLLFLTHINLHDRSMLAVNDSFLARLVRRPPSATHPDSLFLAAASATALFIRNCHA